MPLCPYGWKSRTEDKGLVPGKRLETHQLDQLDQLDRVPVSPVSAANLATRLSSSQLHAIVSNPLSSAEY